MGNVLHKSFEDQAEDDKWACQELSSKVLFDKTFLRTVAKKFKELSDEEKKPKDKADQAAEQSAESMRNKVLADLLTIKKSTKDLSSFADLALDTGSTADGNPDQLLLLLRVHLALLRQVNAMGKSDSTPISLPGLEDKKDDKEKEPASDEPETILLAASTRMSLGFLRVLGPTNPPLFREISKGIVDVITCQRANCLARVDDPTASASVKRVLDDMQSLLFDVQSMDGVADEVKQDAVSLLAALALERGAIPELLRVVSVLDSGVPFTEAAIPVLARIDEHRPDTTLDAVIDLAPNDNTVFVTLPALDDGVFDFEDASQTRTTARIAVGSDSMFVYVYEVPSRKVFKIGTGSGSTVPGRVYSESVDLATIVDDLEPAPAADATDAAAAPAEEEKGGEEAAQEEKTAEGDAAPAEDAAPTEAETPGILVGSVAITQPESNTMEESSAVVEFEGGPALQVSIGSDTEAFCVEYEIENPHTAASCEAVLTYTCSHPNVTLKLQSRRNGETDVTMPLEMSADGAATVVFPVEKLEEDENKIALLASLAGEGAEAPTFPIVLTFVSLTFQNLKGRARKPKPFIPDLFCVPAGVMVEFHNVSFTLDGATLELTAQDEVPAEQQLEDRNTKPVTVFTGRDTLSVSFNSEPKTFTIVQRDPLAGGKVVATIESETVKVGPKFTPKVLRHAMVTTNGVDLCIDVDLRQEISEKSSHLFRVSLRTGKVKYEEQASYMGRWNTKSMPRAAAYDFNSNNLFMLTFDSSKESGLKYSLLCRENRGLRPPVIGPRPEVKADELSCGTASLRLDALKDLAAGFAGDNQARLAKWQASVVLTNLDRLSAAYRKPLGDNTASIVSSFDSPENSKLMCLDVSSDTVAALVRMVLDRKALLLDRVPVKEQTRRVVEDSNFDSCIMLSAMGILSTVLYQLSRAHAKLDRGIKPEEASALKDILMEFFDKPPPDFLENPLAQGALDLYITGLSLFYPTISQQSGLLVELLRQQQADELSLPEGKVLQLLLGKMGEPAQLTMFLEEIKSSSAGAGGSDAGSAAMSLLVSLIALSYKETSSELGQSARGLALALTNFLLSASVQAIVTADDASSPDVKLACSNLTSLFSVVLETAATNPIAQKGPKLDLAEESLIEASPIGSMLPVMLLIIRNTVAKYATTMWSALPEFAVQMGKIAALVSTHKNSVPTDRLEVEGCEEAGAFTTEMREFESVHPYRDCSDEWIEVDFSGAEQLTIWFDPQTRTENGCDFVRFWSDRERSKDLLVDNPDYPGNNMTGRDSTRCYAGLDGKAKLMLEPGMDKFWIEFHSDGSVNDWGWKMFVEANFPEVASSTTKHWLVELEQQVCEVNTELARAMIRGQAMDPSLIEVCSPWMGMLHHTAEEMAEGQDALDMSHLEALATWPVPEGPVADLTAALKKRTPQDQGTVEPINHAVHAVAAALIHHNGLTVEFNAIVNGVRTDPPSTQLCKAWKTAQKMRQFFAFGDVKAAASASAAPAPTPAALGDMPPPGPPALTSKPSLYKDAPDDVVVNCSKDIVARARFMMTLMPMVHVTGEKRTWKMLKKLASSKKLLSAASSSEMDGGASLSVVATAAESLVTSDKLKSLMAWKRRTKQGTKKANKNRTPAEIILEFAQSQSPTVGQLETMLESTTSRAQQRAFGLQLLSSTLQAANDDAKVGMIYDAALSLREIRSPIDQKMHVLADLDGCALPVFQETMAQHANFTATLLQILRETVPKVLQADADKESVRAEALAAVLARTTVVQSVTVGLKEGKLHTMSFACLVKGKPATKDWVLNGSEDPADATCPPFELGEGEFIQSVKMLNSKQAVSFVTNLGRQSDQFGDVEGGDDVQEYHPTSSDNMLVGLGADGSVQEVKSPFGEAVRVPTPKSYGVASAVLRTLACDFDVHDHAMLSECGLVELLEQLLQREGTDGAARAAWDLFELLLSRCLSAGHSEPTAFARMLLGLLSRLLNQGLDNLCAFRAACASTAQPPQPPVDGVDASAAHVVMANVCSGLQGATASHVALPTTYSAAVWVKPKEQGGDGLIWSKGGKRTLSDDDLALPWTAITLSLRSGAVVYEVTVGDKKRTFEVCSTGQLEAGKWSHVAMVQSNDKVLLYIDGQLDGEAKVHASLKMSGGGEIEIESKHPYDNRSDLTWPVSVPGATEFSIVFSEQTRTEANYDWIKFAKTDNPDEFWHADKFSGRDSSTNFPGLNGQPPLIIPASSFTVVFHSDDSNNDWGFLLTATPTVPASPEDEAVAKPMPNNPSPIFIGQPPVAVAASMGVDGLVGGLNMYDVPLTQEQVGALAVRPGPGPVGEPPSDERVLRLLSLLYSTSRPVGSSDAEIDAAAHLLSYNTLEPVVGFSVLGTPAVKMAAKRVFASLAPPPASPDLLSLAAKPQLGLFDCSQGYLRGLLAHVGGVLSAYVATAPSGDALQAEAFADVHHDIIALRDLVASNDSWKSGVKELMTELGSDVAPCFAGLSSSLDAGPVALSPSYCQLVACLALLGGPPKGAFPGCRMSITLNKVSEPGTIVALCSPPKLASDAPKAEAESHGRTWKPHMGFGDAVIIVLDSDPTPMLVPRTDVTVEGNVDGDAGGALVTFADDLVEPLLALLAQLRQPYLQPEPAARYNPKTIEADVEKVIETPHPYDNNMDKYWPIEIEDAKELKIVFSSECRSELNCDYLRIYQDDTHTSTYGAESYWGRDDNNWPSRDGRPDLTIPSNKCVIMFHSDSGDNDWGVHLTIKAHTTKVEHAPPVPPVPRNMALLNMRWHAARAVNAMTSVTTTTSRLVDMAAQLTAGVVNAPSSSAFSAPPPPPLEFESKHPYDHSEHSFTPVCIPGAHALRVSFSEDTKSENNCDYMWLFKDDTHDTNQVWGERYTGGRDNGQSNWPGQKGREPLIVEADHFVIHWHTDGSVNDWGWHMFVEAVMDGGSSGTPLQIEADLADMQLMMSHQSAPMLVPDLAEYTLVEAEGAAEGAAAAVDLDFTANVDAGATSAAKTSAAAPAKKMWFLDITSTPYLAQDRHLFLFETSALSGDNIGEVTPEMRLTGLEETDLAVQVELPAVAGEEGPPKSGWVSRGAVVSLEPSRIVQEPYIKPTKGASGGGSSAAQVDLKAILTKEMDGDEVSAPASAEATPTFDLVPPGFALRGQLPSLSSRVESLLSESTSASMIDSVISLSRHWPKDVPMTADAFGGAQMLLDFTRLCHGSGTGLDVLSKMLAACTQGDSASAALTVSCLAKYALNELRREVSSDGPAMPMRKVSTTDCECQHPYENSWDKYYPIHIPGAKQLELSFDEQTAFENGCDYLRVYRGADTEEMVGPQLTGRVNQGNYPGMANRPPLVVPGDRCRIFLHSDGSNTDWGFKCYAVGVVEEPSEELVKEYEEQLAQAKMPNVKLATFLLDAIAREPSESGQTALLSRMALSLFRKLVETSSDDNRMWVLHLLTNLMQPLVSSTGDLVELEVITELQLMRTVLLTLTQSQDEKEKSFDTKSPLLQALMQVSVILSQVIARDEQVRADAASSPAEETKGEEEGASFAAGEPGSMVQQWNLELCSTLVETAEGRTVARRKYSEPAEEGGPDAGTILGKQGYSSGSVSWSVVLSKSSGLGVRIGAAQLPPTGEDLPLDKPLGELVGFGWGEGKLFGDGKEAAYGPEYKQNDTITVQLDMAQGTLRFLRNSVDCGLAVGAAGSGAAIECDLRAWGHLCPAVSLTNNPDEVRLEQPDASTPDVVSPTLPLLDNADEVAELLRAFARRRLPDAFVKQEVLPAAAQANKSTFDTTEYAATTQTITVPGAASLLLSFNKTTRLEKADSVVLSTQGKSITLDGDTVAAGKLIIPTADSEASNLIHPTDLLFTAAGGSGGGSGSGGSEELGMCAFGTKLVLAGEHMLEVVTFEVDEEATDAGEATGKVRPGHLASTGSLLDGKEPTALFQAQPYTSMDVPMRVLAIADGQPAAGGDVSAAVSFCYLPKHFAGMASLRSAEEIPLSNAVFAPCDLPNPDGSTFRAIQIVAAPAGNAALLSVEPPRAAAGGINIHDRVVRGPAWDYADKDGGLGSPGTVLDIVDWDGKPKAGIKVHWEENDEVGVYRWDVSGSFDLKVLSKPDGAKAADGDNANPEDLLTYSSGVVNVQGSTLTIALQVGGAPPAAAAEEGAEEAPAPWGFGFTCVPTYDDSALAQFPDEVAELQSFYASSLRHDSVLVSYINKEVAKRSMDFDKLLACSWSDLCPRDEDLVALPVLKELIEAGQDKGPAVAPVEEAKAEEVKDGEATEAAAPADDGASVKSVAPASKRKSVAQVRFQLLQKLNAALKTILPYVDLSLVNQKWSLASMLSQCRGLIFSLLKKPIWDAALRATTTPVAMFDLNLSRSRAAKFAQTSDEPDHAGRFMCFSQAFRRMDPMNPSSLRVPRETDRMYNCIFMGERSHDAGGPYRESWSQYAAELESPQLPLLLRTPNGRHSTGQNRERWVVNPGSTTPTHQDLFRFLGKLFGIAIRTEQYMALNIAPFMWDLLVGSAPTLDGLVGIDEMLVQSIDKVLHIDREGVTEEMFQYVVMESYTTLSTDDRTVELLPGGAERDVTFTDRSEYVHLVQQYRLHEFDAQVASIRRGLATVVPTSLLCLFTGSELETMVCGNPEIDVGLLESVTEYSSCNANEQHVRFFWEVMRSFNHEERSMFLRFTWGRSRLPLNAAAFSQRFKLLNFSRSPADQYFPVAHTCFFQLELPRYSSVEIMREKLRYAIFNCQAIDGDDTGVGMAAAAMGWEE